MAAVKLTKNELKKQKDSLKRFQRYLPTLILKKQQLQMVIRQVESEEKEKRAQQEKLRSDLASWIRVFGQDINLNKLVVVKELSRSTGNIAGVDIPVFEDISFMDIIYDLFVFPLWNKYFRAILVITSTKCS